MASQVRAPNADGVYDGIVKAIAGDDAEYLLTCARGLKVPAVNVRMDGNDLLSLIIQQNARRCLDALKRLEFSFDRLSPKENKHPLEEALDANAMIAFECLLRGGADPNGPHSRYGTIMHAAAATRLVDSLIPILCSRHGNPNAVSPRDGSTPLHVAVSRSQVLNAEQLLERGAFANAIDNLGRTPLHLAMGAREYDQLVALLLNFGADPLIADGGELNAIDLARVRESAGLVKTLQEHSSWETKLAPVPIAGRNRPLRADDFRRELLQAVTKGNQEGVRQLFDVRGGELWKPVVATGESPLLVALEKKRLDLAALFLARRVGVHDRDKDNRNIAHYFLAATRNLETIRAFLPVIHQINPTLLTEKAAHGYPPLEAAIALGVEHDTAWVQGLIDSLTAGGVAA